MTTRLGHALRKKFYPRRMFWDYCIKRYDREQAEARQCDCKKRGERCGHPGGRKPPPIKTQAHPPAPPKPRDPGPADVKVMEAPAPPEIIRLGWEYEAPPKKKRSRRRGASVSRQEAKKKFERQDNMGWPPPGYHFEGGMIVPNKPCRSCTHLREDYAKQCKQNLNQCPTCKSKRRSFGRCADNWHSGDCGIMYC